MSSENEQEIIRIIRCNTYYEVLKLSRNATEVEIKSSYRKLARIVHPDKNNSSSNSNKAFVKLTEAYQTLSNQDKRSQYDMPQQSRQSYESTINRNFINHHRNDSFGFNIPFDVYNDITDQFYIRNGNLYRVNRRPNSQTVWSNNRYSQQRQRQDQFGFFENLLNSNKPYIYIILTCAMLCFIFLDYSAADSPKNLYSLSKTSTFNKENYNEHFNFVFYTPHNQRFSRNKFHQVEKLASDEYIRILYTECYRFRQGIL
ncbi:MAG: hypothetical protein MHMPM18_000002 [Marteilia pararefringens]